ncbi:type IA DNA topoisomerase [Paenibacillaceae bacterium]|nr:type IA DNA topoisomerase [Paenibacillaceae bacterium]
MKTLIIAEKPDMGRTIAAVLEPKAQNRRTHLEGEQYIITWAIGHLVSLAEPDHYDPRYKKWNAADLPIIPDRFKLWPNPRTKDQLKVIGDLAKRCGKLVNACDAGREGQLIFHLIRQYLKLKQPVDRLWISDLTPDTIRRGFASLRSDTDYDPLTKAARARSEADWLIGMNASRAFTIRHRTLLSVGRVQTPVLALLYDRHREIAAFQSEKFYVIHALFEQARGSYKGVWQGDRITDPEQAAQLAAKVKGKQGAILSYEVTESKEYPYRLYDLTMLQRDANGKFGFSAKKTLDVAQALYEKHKVISYPRTNSNYVTEENIPVMGKALQMLQNTSYKPLADGADPGRVHKGNRGVCNPAKVEDHHAIIPTPKKAGTLSADEQKIYDLIVRRFLSHYYPPAQYKNHEVLTVVAEETFKTKVKQEMDPGWKVVMGGQDADEQKPKSRRKKEDTDEAEEELITGGAFAVDPADPVHCAEAEAKEKATQPPKPFTEGTLLKAMETAGKAIEDDELKEAMKDTGLGTPATRAATIERLKQVGYITLTGKRLEMTAKGSAAIELIRGAGVELLASPEMTGRWEQRLHEISKGAASDEQFIAKVKQFAVMVVDKVREQQQAAPSLFQQEEGTQQSARGRKTSPVKDGQKPSGAAKTPRTSSVRSSTRGNASSNGQPPGKAVPGSSSATAASAQLTALAPCPRRGCNGQMIEGKRGFGCTAYRDGCTFVIWKQQSGKTVTAAMAKSLAVKGTTGKLSFKQSNGDTSKGRFVLHNSNSGELTVQYED